MMLIKKALWTFFLFLSLTTSGCSTAFVQSIGGDSTPIYERVYLTDYDTAWQSALESLKDVSLETSNRESGVIQTRWTENTTDKNFTDSFGVASSYLKAQYRLKVSVAKGYYNGKQSIKVNVIKEQLVEHDILEGWQMTESDGVYEKTLLYRIGRLISIRSKIGRLEEERARKEIDSTKF